MAEGVRAPRAGRRYRVAVNDDGASLWQYRQVPLSAEQFRRRHRALRHLRCQLRPRRGYHCLEVRGAGRRPPGVDGIRGDWVEKAQRLTATDRVSLAKRDDREAALAELALIT